MAAHAFNAFDKPASAARDAVGAERKLRPVPVKAGRKLSRTLLQESRPQSLVIHDIRELLHITGMVLAVAQTRTSNDVELLHFLKLGERSIADVATLIAAHFPKGL